MADRHPKLSTEQKALEINLDEQKYGTIVEIGAGQEVARQFFSAGAAAGTIAKTSSAYDMQISDAIYGKTDRSVSLERVRQMMDHEYGLHDRATSKPANATAGSASSCRCTRAPPPARSCSTYA